MRRKYLVVIAGPTGVGKTDVAIAVAKHFSTEIVSADSRQFYRQMRIGTARPADSQLSQVTHHFVGHKNIAELYGAGHFERDAVALLGGLFARHDTVILVGGSGLYINAVLEGVDDLPDVPASVRTQLNHSYKEKGLPWLQEEVRRCDPEYFETVDRENPQRLIRALEVHVHTGKKFSSMLGKRRVSREFVPVKIMLNLPRVQLYERINRRVDEMMKEGLAEEARSLLPFRHLNALKTVGYKELFDHFDGKISLAEAVEQIRQHTRNYAKRQITWFRNKGGYTELPPDAEEVIAHINRAIDAV